MAFREWADEHQGLWEFIKFNILSNVSTLARFAFSWIGTAIFVKALAMTQPFGFLIFDYTAASSNGLGGFLTFLIAETVAQVVNFFVQMKLVFKSDAAFSQSGPKYAVLAVLIIVVNLVLPGHLTNFFVGSMGLSSELAATLVAVVNTLLAVVVSFPLLKFWIAPEGGMEK